MRDNEIIRRAASVTNVYSILIEATLKYYCSN